MASERPKAKPRVVKNIWASAKAREKLAPKPVSPTDRAKNRVQQDLTQVDAPTAARLPLNFPNPDDILKMTLTLKPGPHVPSKTEPVDVAYYAGGVFHFDIHVPQEFPFQPPKFQCKEKIYHPNIDLQGNVCLDILRKYWTAAVSLYAVILDLEQLFVGLRADDAVEPLNLEAAQDYNTSKESFRRNVRTAMAGGTVNKQSYDRVLK